MSARISGENRKDMLLSAPVGPTILKMSVPTVIAMLITSVYHLADTYFVSSLGTNATAAVSVNSSLDLLVTLIGSTMALGGSSLTSRLLGAHEQDNANIAVSTAFFPTLIISFVFGIIGLSFIEPLVDLLGATATCRQYSVDYATYILFAAPFMATSFVLSQCVRAEGWARLSSIGMSFGGVLNVILDPIFIFDFNLGVAGASIATAISKFVSFCILLTPYIMGKTQVRISYKYIRIARSPLADMISVGSSAALRSGCSILSAILINNIAGRMGDAVMAGVGVTTKVMMFPFSVIMGLGQGSSPVVGFNWGAKRLDRVWECFRATSKYAFIVSTSMAVLIWVFAKPIIVAFAGTDEAMIRIGLLCIRSQCIALPIHGWVGVVNFFSGARGDAKNAILLATSRQGSCFIPTLFLLAFLAGDIGVAFTQAAADILTLFIAVPVMIKFRKKYY